MSRNELISRSEHRACIRTDHSAVRSKEGYRVVTLGDMSAEIKFRALLFTIDTGESTRRTRKYDIASDSY